MISRNTQSEGPVAVVIGAAGGNGRSLCRKLAAVDVGITAMGRDATLFDELAAGLAVRRFLADASDVDGLAEVFQRVASALGGINAVANLAGSMLLKSAHRTSAGEWSKVITANLITAFATVRAAASTMKRGGSVVLVSSVAARTGLANHEAFAAAKAGVEGLVRSAAATYASRGLRFNAVAPGSRG